MKTFYMVVQPCPAVYELLMDGFGGNWNGVAYLLQRVRYLLHHLPWRKVGSMKVDSEMPEPDPAQSAQNDFERCALFRHKQNTISRCSQGCDQVRDGLTLTSAWRAMHDRVLARENARDSTLLARIRIEHNEFVLRWHAVDRFGIGVVL